MVVVPSYPVERARFAGFSNAREKTPNRLTLPPKPSCILAPVVEYCCRIPKVPHAEGDCLRISGAHPKNED